MAAYEVLLLNTAIPQIQAAQAGDTYVCPRDIQITANLDVTGNTILGDASTDTVQVNGYVGVGATPSPTTALFINSTALTGVSQTGIFCSPTATSAATGTVAGFVANPKTEAAAFTAGNVRAFEARDATKGAGSTITNQHGVYIADQTQGTNNYGITSIVSSGTNKWNIYASGTAANYFAGQVGIGDVFSGTTYGRLQISGNTGNAIGLSITNTTANVTNKDARIKSFHYTTAEEPVTMIRAVSDSSTSTLYIGGSSGVENSATDITFWTGATNTTTTGTERLRIDSSGNVGIGTSAPDRLLQLSSADTAYLRFENQDSTGAVGQFIGLMEFEGQDSGGSGVRAQIGAVYEGTNGATAVSIGTSADAGSVTERFRVDRNGNVGIGTSSPNASAILDAQSTTKGVRMPNMTTTQKNAIASPAAGLIVFDTTLAKLCVYSGAAWETITSV